MALQSDLHHPPDFAQAKVLDVVVDPGESVFLPLGWWYGVSSLDPSTSFSSSSPDVPNSFSSRNPHICNW